MATENFDWKAGLANLFGASVNQQTLEEAAELMASVTTEDDRYHEECLTMFNEGIRAANLGDASVITCINKSGYQVSTIEDASKLLDDFRVIYLTKYAYARS